MEIERIGEKIAHLAEISGDVSYYCKQAEDGAPIELQLLNLHGNLLRSLNGLPDALPSALQSTLVELNLSSNLIASSHMPELTLLCSLRILDLSGNRLSSIDKLPSIPSLLSLSIAFNALENLFGVRNCPNLVHLDCHGNRINDARGCVELEMLGSLEELWFASSEDGRSPNPICSRPVEMISIFDDLRFYGRIDGRNRSSWALEVPAAVPAAVSADSRTPRFDRLLHKQQKQLLAPFNLAGSRYEAEVVKVVAPVKLSDEVKCVKLVRILMIVIQSLKRRALYLWRGFAAVTRAREEETAKHSRDTERIETMYKGLLADEMGKNQELREEVTKLQDFSTKQQLVINENTRERDAAEQSVSAQLARERERAEEFRAQLVHLMSVSGTQEMELKRLQEILSSTQAERDGLLAAADASRVESEARALVIVQLTKQTEEEHNKNIEASKKVSQLEENSRMDRDIIAALEVRTADLETRLREAESRFQLAENAQKSMSFQIGNLEANLLQAHAVSEEDKRSIQKLESELTLARELSAGLENENKRLLAAVEVSDGLHQVEQERAAATIAEMQRKVDEQKSSMSQMCVVIDDLKLALKKIYDRCKQLEAQRAELRESNRKLSEDINSISSKHKIDKESTLNVIESIRLEYEKTIVDLVTKCKQANDQLATAENRIQAQTIAASAQEKEEFEYRIRVKDRMLEDQASAMKELKAKSDERVEDIRRRCGELERALSNAQNTIEELNIEVANSVKVEKHLRKLLKKNSEEIETGNADFPRARSRSRSSDRSARPSEEIRREIQSLHEALQQKNRHLETAQAELGKLVNDLDSFRSQISTLQSERDALNLELSELRSRFDSSIREKESELNLIRTQSSMAQSALEAARVAASRTEQELRAHIAEKDAELFRANESLKKFRETINALAQTTG